jgi:hypothetical protein
MLLRRDVVFGTSSLPSSLCTHNLLVVRQANMDHGFADHKKGGKGASRCTISAHADRAKVYVWDKDELRLFLRQKLNAGLEVKVLEMLSHAATTKLRRSLSQGQQQSSLSIYTEALKMACSDGVLLPVEKGALAHFRHEHHISQTQHAALLCNLGWTQAEYDIGEKHVPADSTLMSKTMARLNLT